MTTIERTILENLVKEGTLSKSDAAGVRRRMAKGEALDAVLSQLRIPEAEIMRVASKVLGVRVYSLAGKKISLDVLKKIPEESAQLYGIIPLEVDGGKLVIGAVDPSDIQVKEAVKFIAGKQQVPYEIVLISRLDFQKALQEYKGLSVEATKVLEEFEASLEQELAKPPMVSGKKKAGAAAETEKTEEPIDVSEEAPITRMAAMLLRHGVVNRASDIHIEPGREKLRVRFRVDGVLHTNIFFPRRIHEALVSRIKILSNMQLDEKRKPQDGRFSAAIEERSIDFRVSTFPTYFGEKVVMRILDPQTGLHSLSDLGLYGRNLEAIEEALAKPYGLILITGPTGSGKSTTLYAMLQNLNEEKRNVVSLEDPVEYAIEGVNQSQIRPEIGYTFATGLRHILRQDPDVIMVGEIRDKETAQLAIHAALTGHVVLATLHTNNALGVIPRLIDMGVDHFLIAPTLTLAIAQRLVRTLCEDAREPLTVSGKIKERIEKEITEMPESVRGRIKLPERIFRPGSSPSCPTGTKGRVAVFEVFEMTSQLEEIILREPSETALLTEAKRQGMITMRQDGILKILEGKVSLETLEEAI